MCVEVDAAAPWRQPPLESTTVKMVGAEICVGTPVPLRCRRYQIIAGVIEERGIERLFAGRPSVAHLLSFIIRTGNTFLGSLLWVRHKPAAQTPGLPRLTKEHLAKGSACSVAAAQLGGQTLLHTPSTCLTPLLYFKPRCMLLGAATSRGS